MSAGRTMRVRRRTANGSFFAVGRAAQQVDGLLHGAARLGEASVVGGAAATFGGCLAEKVEGPRVEVGDDGLEAVGEIVVPPHGRASASRSMGCRTSTPEAARCMAQPGLALATTWPPARPIAASLRSRISRASFGWSAE